MKKKNRSLLKGILALALSALLSVSIVMPLSGCGGETAEPSVPEYTEEAKAEQQEFETFCDDLFEEEVTQDTLSLHFCLSKPEDYGIKTETITIGDVGGETKEEDIKDLEEARDSLQKFHRENLTAEQQLTYDILKTFVRDQLEYDTKYDFYENILGASDGIAINLPITLAQYEFGREQDVKDYIALLQDVPRFFQDAAAYAKEQAKRGLFMTDEALQKTVESCEDFLQNKEQHYLIDTFEKRIAAADYLSPDQKRQYTEQNQNALAEYVFPAYETLIKELKTLQGSGKNPGGLANFPNGKDYYEKKVRMATGSDRTIAELKTILEQKVQENYGTVMDGMMNHPEYYSRLTGGSSADAQATLETIQKRMKGDFPEIGDYTFRLEKLPESLGKGYSAAAFYRIPQYDSLDNNVICINPVSESGGVTDLTTISHEGIPGHLYQYTYFYKKNPGKLRYVLKTAFLGYTEGWAEYTSNNYALLYLGEDKDFAGFAKAYEGFDRNLASLLDIRIHYDGWTKQQVADSLVSYGIPAYSSDEIYDTLVEMPAVYLSYSVGQIEMEELRKEAEEALGSRFSAKEFHTFLLDVGPAQFEIIRDRMQEWIRNQ